MIEFQEGDTYYFVDFNWNNPHVEYVRDSAGRWTSPATESHWTDTGIVRLMNIPPIGSSTYKAVMNINGDLLLTPPEKHVIL